MFRLPNGVLNENECGSDAVRVFGFGAYPDFYPVGARKVFVNRANRIRLLEPRKAFAEELPALQIEREIIQHNVLIAVVVQVGETGTVRDAVQIKTPVGGPVSKGEIPSVAKAQILIQLGVFDLECLLDQISPAARLDA